jgi:chromosome segregation protein
VLGETSMKQIRSKESTDVIFKGSGSATGAKFAEVTLVFDNSNKVLHYDGSELSVTKRIDRETKESQYLVNGQVSRKKDVTEIFLDCGLSKGSLGIISQGEVKAFPEAKPENRRKIFEEAAGIGLYLKDKLESNKHLAVAEENYIRKNDMVNDEASEIKKLVKQAEKANIYNEKKKELTKLDLTILAKDINYYSAKLETVTEECNKLDDIINSLKPDTEVLNQSIETNKKELENIELNVDNMNTELNSITNELNTLNFKKTQLTMSLESELSSANLQTKIAAYKTLIASTKQDIADQKERIVQLEQEINTFQSINTETANKYTSMKKTLDEREQEIRNLRLQLQSMSTPNR